MENTKKTSTRKIIAVLMIALLAIAGVGLYVASRTNISYEDDPLELVLQENQRIDNALNSYAKPPGWVELDCSIEASGSPGSTPLKSVSISPESDPAKDCDDNTNVFFVRYGLEMRDLPCDTPPAVANYKELDRANAKSGCEIVELGSRTYTKDVSILVYSHIVYTARDDLLLSIKYHSDENGNLPYVEEVEKHIASLQI